MILFGVEIDCGYLWEDRCNVTSLHGLGGIGEGGNSGDDLGV
jgi:hypothetical protein